MTTRSVEGSDGSEALVAKRVSPASPVHIADREGVARQHRRSEAGLDVVEPHRVAGAHRVQERPAGEAVAAQAVQDRTVEATDRGERRVRVQRVAVAGQPVDERLVDRGLVGHDVVGVAFGRHVLRPRRSPVAAPSAFATDERRRRVRVERLAVHQRP